MTNDRETKTPVGDKDDTSTDSAGHPYVAPNDEGLPRFRPGNPGKPRGAKNKAKTARRVAVEDRKQLAATAHEKVMETVSPELQNLVRRILDRAMEGDMSAAGLLMKHAVPPAPKTVIRDAGDLRGVPPADRIPLITDRVTAGNLSVEEGRVLIAMAESEISANLVEPLIRLARKFRQTRDVAAFVEEFEALPLGNLIEGEVEDAPET